MDLVEYNKHIIYNIPAYRLQKELEQLEQVVPEPVEEVLYDNTYTRTYKPTSCDHNPYYGLDSETTDTYSLSTYKGSSSQVRVKYVIDIQNPNQYRQERNY